MIVTSHKVSSSDHENYCVSRLQIFSEKRQATRSSLCYSVKKWMIVVGYRRCCWYVTKTMSPSPTGGYKSNVYVAIRLPFLLYMYWSMCDQVLSRRCSLKGTCVTEFPIKKGFLTGIRMWPGSWYGVPHGKCSLTRGCVWPWPWFSVPHGMCSLAGIRVWLGAWFSVPTEIAPLLEEVWTVIQSSLTRRCMWPRPWFSIPHGQCSLTGGWILYCY